MHQYLNNLRLSGSWQLTSLRVYSSNGSTSLSVTGLPVRPLFANVSSKLVAYDRLEGLCTGISCFRRSSSNKDSLCNPTRRCIPALSVHETRRITTAGGTERLLV